MFNFTNEKIEFLKAKEMKFKVFFTLCIINSALILNAQQNAWTYKTGGTTSSIFPLISGNVFYSASNEGILAAHDLKNGKVIWSFKADGAIAMTPAIADNIAYFCAKTGNVYAFDLSLKKVKWTVNVGDKLICTPVIYQDLVIVNSKNFFLALDKEVGLDIWKTEFKTTGNPLLKLYSNVLCFSDNMKVVALNPADGKLIWSYSLPVFGQSDVFIISGKVYFTNAEKLYCLSISDGKEIWNRIMSDKFSSTIHATPIVNENMLVISCGQEIIAFTADKGQELWRTRLKTTADLHSPVFFQGLIYVAEYGTKIFCLNPEKGKTQKVFDVNFSIGSDIFIDKNWVYYYTSDGTACAFYLTLDK